MTSISHSECVEIAKKYLQECNVELEHFHLEPITGEKRGHLGEYYKLVLKIKGGKHIVLFAKKILSAPNRLQFVNLVTGKEVKFYKHMEYVKNKLPSLDYSFAPACYHTTPDIIILQDLSLEGYENPKYRHLDERHMKLALQCLAKFHATSLVQNDLIKNRLKENDFLVEAMFSTDKNYIGSTYMTCLTKGICKVIEFCFNHRLSIYHFKKKFIKKVSETLDNLNKTNNFQNVICHGDLWANNILYKYNYDIPEQCKIIDFQLIRHAPPAHDVTTLIIHNTDYREINIDELLEFYYHTLDQELQHSGLNVKNIISKEEYQTTCGIYLKVAKITKLLYKAMEAAIIKRNILQNRQPLDVIMTEKDAKFTVDIIMLDNKFLNDFQLHLIKVEDMLLNEIITEEDCLNIMQHKLCSNNFKIVDYKLTQFSKRHDIFEEKYNLCISVSQENKNNDYKFLMEKLSPNATIAECNRFKKARYLCSDNADVIRLNYNQNNSDLLVFDNLYLEGYELVDGRKPFSVDEVKIVVMELAKLHALGFKNDFILHGHQDDQVENNDDALNAILEQTKLFSNRTPNVQFINIISNILKNNMTSMYKPSKKYINTLNHGKLSPSHIMMKYIDNKPVCCKFVNFKSCRYRPPMEDLMSFLHMTTTKSFRAFYMEETQEMYFSTLKAKLKELGTDVLFDYTDFMRSVEEVRLIAVIQALFHHRNYLVDEKLLVDLHYNEDMENYETCRLEARQDMQQNDPIYIERQREIIADLLEMYDKRLL